MNPLSRGGNQSRGKASTKLKVMPALVTVALPELGGCRGKQKMHGIGEGVSREGRGSGLYSVAKEQHCSKNPLGTVSGGE